MTVMALRERTVSADPEAWVGAPTDAKPTPPPDDGRCRICDCALEPGEDGVCREDE